MATLLEEITARTVPTQFVDVGGRTLAYRKFGDGPPMLLCLRFRGVMDSWDPAFLDALAENFTVITFDYSGLGQSSGTPSYVREAMAMDARDLADALELDRIVIVGWSIGGIAAQIFAAMNPELTSHAVLIGTGPPGPQAFQSEAIFLPTALKPVNTLEDKYILFFEPESPRSRLAAQASESRMAERSADRSIDIPEDVYGRILAASHDPTAAFPDPAAIYGSFLADGSLPVLAINGDHDVVFPVENWYALNRKWKSLHVLTVPDAGHGPQHQEPRWVADSITSFVRNVR